MEFNIEKYYMKSFPIFHYLTEDDMRYISGGLTRKELVKGETLLKEGSYAKGIYIVQKGKIKIFQTNREGKQSIVYIYRHDDFFGYRLLLSETPVNVSAV